MAKIKLYKVGENPDGTQRFQSQLYVGTDTADFIMRNDGIMRNYGENNFKFDFYEFNGEYEIVADINDMNVQAL